MTADLQQAMTGSASRVCCSRYAHVFMVQASQTAPTNGHASIEERLARWISMSHDRFSNNDLTVTHEFIALDGGRAASEDHRSASPTGRTTFYPSPREKNLHVVGRRPGLIELASGSYGVCEAEYERLIDGKFRRSIVP